jgi:hypothetical protein
LLTLLGLENAVIEDAETVERVVGFHADGMDSADALHVASSRIADQFVTFDRRLAASARPPGDVPEVRLLDGRE